MAQAYASDRRSAYSSKQLAVSHQLLARRSPGVWGRHRLGLWQDLRNDTIDWGNHGGIAPTNTRYGQASVSPVWVSCSASCSEKHL
ncbi:MAG: hypothetical protein F6J93_32190 [Oscillatoria sp. SIO1A7]|nr:hypothetical protein [Oscillatoria sp. SIO1A7]